MTQLYWHEKSCKVALHSSPTAVRKPPLLARAGDGIWEKTPCISTFISKLALWESQRRSELPLSWEGNDYLFPFKVASSTTFFPMSILTQPQLFSTELQMTVSTAHHNWGIGNKRYLSFFSSSCQSSVKTYTDLFGNIPLMTVKYEYRRQLADDFW